MCLPRVMGSLSGQTDLGLQQYLWKPMKTFAQIHRSLLYDLAHLLNMHEKSPPNPAVFYTDANFHKTCVLSSLLNCLSLSPFRMLCLFLCYSKYDVAHQYLVMDFAISRPIKSHHSPLNKGWGWPICSFIIVGILSRSSDCLIPWLIKGL